MRSLCCLATGLFFVALAATPSSAQVWPQRSVRLIVPVGAGTAVDTSARVFADRLSKRWKQPVVVENRPGADGILAVTSFVNTRDNHTLLYSFGGPVTINPVVHEKLPYDPARDLVPITSTSNSFLAVAVSESLQIRSVADLVRLVRSRPSQLNWAATPGLPQFIFAGFVKSASLDIVQAPYRDATHAVNDLVEGRIQVMATSMTTVLPQVHAGKVRLLVVTTRQRAPLAPEVPTAVEAGYPELAADGFQGLFGWRDMPNDLREQISADVRAVAAEPAVVERLAHAGNVVWATTPAEFAAMIEDQRAKVAAIAHAIGIKAMP